MTDRKLRLRLGLFMAASLITLGGLVVLFGAAPNLFSDKARYSVLFSEAPGISVGTPVRKSGVRIGEVTALDLDPATSQVRVRVALDPRFPPRKNEDPIITRSLLSADTAIDFVPRLDENGQPLPRGDDYPPGSDIPGLPPVTARSLLTPASGVINTAQQSLDRISGSFEKLEKTIPKLEAAATEISQMARAAREAIPRFETAAEEITHLARDARQLTPDLKRTLERIQSLIGAADPGPALPPGAVAAQQPQPPKQNQASLRSLLQELQEAVRAVRPAVEDIRGAVRRLEPEVTAAARSARQTLDTAKGTFEGINEVLSPENRKQITETMKNMNSLVFTILKLSGAFQDLLTEAQKSVQNLNRRVDQAGDILGDVRAITKPLAARSEELVTDVADSARQLNKLLAEVREAVRVFAREDGTIHKLLTDANLYQNLDAAALGLARVLARADKIARDLEVFADKVARRPELIGVGGALRPSAGLKDPPFGPLPGGVPSYRPDWPPAIPATRPGNPDWPLPPVRGLPPRP